MMPWPRGSSGSTPPATTADTSTTARCGFSARATSGWVVAPTSPSDRHPWFEDSRSSRQSDRRDWYVWRDAREGGPPTNWLSEFGGPAWTWDEATGQYYLHMYLREQPALNWRNPDVRAAMFDIMRFWFERGVDGFRIDAAAHIAPNPDGGDHPPNPDWQPHMDPAQSLRRIHARHQPETHEVVRQMREIADAFPERVLVGEAYGTIDEVMRYYGDDLDGFHLPFNFELISAPWNAAGLARLIEDYEAALPAGAWPNWVLGNHDRRRVASRVGTAQARVAAMLLLTLRGTPTIYQGEELGLLDGEIPPGAVQDPWERNAPGLGLGRDPVRTPMLWDETPNAGFTTGRPWLPQTPGAPASVQARDPASMLSLYRALVALRRAEPALSVGSYRTVSARGDVLVFRRAHDGRALTVALNLGSEERDVALPGRLLLSTRAERKQGPVERLLPDEGVVVEP